MPEGQQQWVPAGYPPSFGTRNVCSARGKAEGRGARALGDYGVRGLLLPPRGANNETVLEAYLTQEGSTRALGPFQQREAGSAYLQRWSALSSKGVSFSRNSKAQLTSSVKSYKEPERAIWLLGLPPSLPQPAMQGPRGAMRYESLQAHLPTHWLPGPGRGEGGGSPRAAVLAPVIRHLCLRSSLAALGLQTGCVRAMHTHAQAHSRFPRHKNSLLRSPAPSPPLPLQGGNKDPPIPMPPHLTSSAHLVPVRVLLQFHQNLWNLEDEMGEQKAQVLFHPGLRASSVAPAPGRETGHSCPKASILGTKSKS